MLFLTRLLVFEFALPGGLLRPFAAAAISRMPVDVGLVARCFFAQARVLLRIVLCRCGGLRVHAAAERRSSLMSTEQLSLAKPCGWGQIMSFTLPSAPPPSSPTKMIFEHEKSIFPSTLKLSPNLQDLLCLAILPHFEASEKILEI